METVGMVRDVARELCPTHDSRRDVFFFFFYFFYLVFAVFVSCRRYQPYSEINFRWMKGDLGSSSSGISMLWSKVGSYWDVLYVVSINTKLDISRCSLRGLVKV